ncbi:FMN-binding negative transcriptional regulator [Agrobacterium vitis]|nr:FMN-binding negative transcriptional regulator [Agrobacterium vitis]
MHYAEFKMPDAGLLQTLIERFPFAMIAINGVANPIVAQAPLTFRQVGTSSGALEFHLASQNPITKSVKNGTVATIVVNGPNAHISPSWYISSFCDASADRSRTAPTWNYLSATLIGRLRQPTRVELEEQIADMVAAHESADGWRFAEIDPRIFASWCDMLIGYRMDIVSFDLTAKLSQNQARDDKPGIASGLRLRAGMADNAVAVLIQGFDGTPASVQTALANLQATCPLEKRSAYHEPEIAGR